MGSKSLAALVMYSTYSMAKTGIKNIATVIIFLAAFKSYWPRFDQSIIIVLAAAATGLVIGLIKKKLKKEDSQ